MMHPLFACRQLNAGPLQTQRLWSSNSMLLDTKLNAIAHQTQCYWNLSSRVYEFKALPFTPLPLGEGLGVRLFVPSLPSTISCPGLLTLYIKDMKFRLVNLNSLQTIRPYAHEGVVVFF